MHKQIALEGRALVVTYVFGNVPDARFEVELNLAMPSCDGPAGRFEMNEEVLGGFAQQIQSRPCDEIRLRDDILGGQLMLLVNQTATLRSAPCFSVSQSEAGFEKIMQAVTLHLDWSCQLLKSPLVIRLTIDS